MKKSLSVAVASLLLSSASFAGQTGGGGGLACEAIEPLEAAALVIAGLACKVRL